MRKNATIPEVDDKYVPTTRFDEYLKFHNPDLIEQYKNQQPKFKQANKTYFRAVEVLADPLYKEAKGIESYAFEDETLLGKFPR